MTSAYTSEVFFQRLLNKARDAGASDVHIKVGQPPGARVRGDLVYFKGDKIVGEDTRAAAKLMLGKDERLEAAQEIVAVYRAGHSGRFRVSVFRQQGELSIVMRPLPPAAPSLAELGVPGAVTALAERRRGLVIVAGGAGQGKTSTVAAMIKHLVTSHPRHVITLEDPIEIEHDDAIGAVAQREIGSDVASFADGLRAAARQDPDVIAVSELQGAEAFEAALDAAELGRLVIAVVPAPSVAHAVSRLFAMGREVGDVESRLGAALEGVVAQRLLPKRDGSGRALACEILVATPAVRDVIRSGPTDLAMKLRGLMERGAAPHGMCTFDAHEAELAAHGVTSARSPAP